MRLCIFVCTFLACMSACMSTTRLPRLPGLSWLCPDQNVCANTTWTTDITTNQSDYNSNAGCCTECSCEANCYLDGTCCFTSMMKTTYRKYQSCVSIQVKEYTDRFKLSKAYYMVTKIPQNGCIFSTEGETAHDLDIDIVPWGNLVPVTSLATKKIYKNQKLAECHGDNKTCVVWTAYLACDTFRSVDDDLENCNIYFNYPGPEDDIRHERCFTEKASQCPDTFKLDSKVALAPEDVRAACASDFQSEYSISFPVKNVYCFVCIVGKQEDAGHCTDRTSSEIRSELIKSNSFVSVIELRSQTIHLKQSQHQPFSHPKVCQLHNGHMTSTCRKSLCPSGQVRSRLDGKCTFASSKWMLYKKDLRIEVKVSIDSTTKTFTNHHLAELINTGRLKIVLNNWSFQYWMIEYVRDFKLDTNQSGPLTDFESAENLTATHFYAVFGYGEGEVDPEQLLRETNIALEKKNLLKWQNHAIRMTKTLANTKSCYAVHLVDVVDVPNSQCVMYSYLARTENNNFFYDTANVYMVINREAKYYHTRSQFYFTKLMYCSQVELQVSDVDILHYEQTKQRYAPLVVTKAGTILFDGEFEISQTSSGEIVIKVCQEDADYVDVSSKGSHACFVGLIQLLITVLI